MAPPTAVAEEKEGSVKGLCYSDSIKSSSTIESEVLTYAPEIILIGSSNEALKGETAVMDATDEESFTLDTFDRLIRKSHSHGKAFLLARVTTADPYDPQRLYHSYYSAHHINKVLFRTQPELSLLHRMKSHNPLNNMPIIGDVDYYMIDTKSVEKARKQLHIETIKDEFSKPALSKLAKKHKRTMSDSTNVPYKASQPIKPLPNNNNNTLSYHTSIRLTESMDSLMLQGKVEAPVEEGGKKKIRYEAKFFATDDDFLMKNEVREIFKKSSVNSDDYMLFTLHTNSHMGPNGEIIMFEHQRQTRPREPATWSNLWRCINTHATPSLTNRFTGVLTNRGLALFFMCYLIAAVITLKFLIPIAYVYLVGFLFAFVFVMVLVLFVEAGPR